MRPFSGAASTASFPTRHLAALRLHNRRHDVLRVAGIYASAQSAVPHAVEEINDEADGEPDEEPDPGQHRQTKHERDAEDDAENRKERHHRDPEWARAARIGAPQNNDPETNEDKGEERADVCQVSQGTDVGNHGHAADSDAGPDGSDVWGAETGMDPREIARQQTVACHGH